MTSVSIAIEPPRVKRKNTAFPNLMASYAFALETHARLITLTEWNSNRNMPV